MILLKLKFITLERNYESLTMWCLSGLLHSIVKPASFENSREVLFVVRRGRKVEPEHNFKDPSAPNHEEDLV